jgi:pilus assembly protein Flp/PilA
MPSFRPLTDFLRHDDGATAVEYAVLLSLVVVVCLTSITSLGTNANKTFTKVSNALSASS